MSIVNMLFSILVFPGFLFVSVVGLLLAGLDRKFVARMQRRVGPPLLQPLYDFLKLLGKEIHVPHQANRTVFLYAPVVGYISLVVTMLFIPIMGYSAFSGNADLIVILYLLTIPGVCLIVGGSASASPFAGIGISREMVTMMSYELPFIIILLTVAKKTGGNVLCFSLTDIAMWQRANGCNILNWSVLPAAAAMLLVIPAEVGIQPFDVAEAETEICEGPLVEYSGAPLGMFKMNTALKMCIMTSLFVSLFIGGIDTGIVAVNVLIHVLLCIVVTFFSMSLIHGITARLKVEQLFKFYWTTVAGLSIASLVLVWIGL